MRSLILLPLAGLAALFLSLTSCATSDYAEAFAARRAEIASEPPGDYYIGRRFFIERSRIWGYVRRPRQSWDSAQLVIMEEAYRRQPDRVPELPEDGGLAHGFDDSFTYRLTGTISGRPDTYDPATNLFLRSFVLRDYSVISRQPSWLFHPTERRQTGSLLRDEPEARRVP